MNTIDNRFGPDEPEENSGKKSNEKSSSGDEEFEQHYGDLEGGDAGADVPETDHDTEFLE